MKNGTRIFLIILIVLLILGYIAAFTYCTVQKYAYADEIAQNNELYNFNQLANYYDFSTNYYSFSSPNSNGYVTITLPNQNVWWARLPFGTAIGDVSSHKLYIKQDNNKTYDLSLYYNSSTNPQDLGKLVNNTSMVLYGYTDYGFSFHNATANTFPIDLRLIVIDLTLMGLDNLSKEECDNLFVSSYYPYTTGTPVYLDTLKAYAQGASDMFNEYETTIYQYSAWSSCYVLKDLYSNSILEKYAADENYPDGPYLLYSGYLAIPLYETVKAGQKINLHINPYPNLGGAAGYYNWLGVLYYDTFYPLLCLDGETNGFIYDPEIIVPYDTNTLVISTSRSDTIYSFSAATVYLSDLYVEGAQFNLENLIYAIQEGEKTTQQLKWENYIKAVYGENGIEWQNIYDLGYNAGIIEANTNLNVMQYMKTAFITLGEILQIEVFPNFTLGAFFMLPIITSAVFFVIKIAKGGS